MKFLYLHILCVAVITAVNPTPKEFKPRHQRQSLRTKLQKGRHPNIWHLVSAENIIKFAGVDSYG